MWAATSLFRPSLPLQPQAGLSGAVPYHAAYFNGR
jgi:hypothetical protein